jgi:hypothetical protein
VAQVYTTLAPVIVAGVLNMVWVKLPVARWASRPIDAGRTLADGRRVLGDHKTWKGLLGMVVLGALAGLAWGRLIHGIGLEPFDLFYARQPNTIAFSALTGALQGLAYSLFELPNSFLKRRVGITPGKRHGGAWTVLFVVLDQIDSVVGCALLVLVFAPVGWAFVLVTILAGGITHLALNVLLYALHLRKNPL